MLFNGTLCRVVIGTYADRGGGVALGMFERDLMSVTMNECQRYVMPGDIVLVLHDADPPYTLALGKRIAAYAVMSPKGVVGWLWENELEPIND